MDVRLSFSTCCLLSVSLQEPTVVNRHFNSLCFLILILKNVSKLSSIGRDFVREINFSENEW